MTISERDQEHCTKLWNQHKVFTAPPISSGHASVLELHLDHESRFHWFIDSRGTGRPKHHIRTSNDVPLRTRKHKIHVPTARKQESPRIMRIIANLGSDLRLGTILSCASHFRDKQINLRGRISVITNVQRLDKHTREAIDCAAKPSLQGNTPRDKNFHVLTSCLTRRWNSRMALSR